MAPHALLRAVSSAPFCSWQTHHRPWLSVCRPLRAQDFVGEARAFHFFGVLAKRAPEEAEGAMTLVGRVLEELVTWATEMVEPLPRARAMQLVKELLHGAEVSGAVHELVLALHGVRHSDLRLKLEVRPV